MKSQLHNKPGNATCKTQKEEALPSPHSSLQDLLEIGEGRLPFSRATLGTFVQDLCSRVLSLRVQGMLSALNSNAGNDSLSQ